MIVLRPAYTRAWLLLGALALVVEVKQPGPWAWLIAFGLGLALEMVTALNEGAGDTLSEQLFAFQTDPSGGWRWTRAFLVAGVAGWIALRFYQLGPGGDFARGFLAAGLGAWLVLHWTLRGRYG